VLLTFPQIFSPQVKKLGALMPALFGILVAANFISSVGIWYMKQWGVELYLISFFSKILFDMSINEYGFGFYWTIVVSFFFSCVLIRFYRRMDANL
jgi:hypothetical protein